jgi:sarcosine oxidase subunit gamma
MADLTQALRRTSLEGFHGGSGTVRLTPAPVASRISLRARAEDVTALSTALGLVLPTRPKTSSTSADGRLALWLGPDEWLVIDDKAGGLMEACAASGALHSATDVSHRNTAIVVSGPGAEAAINAGCSLNLSPKVFPVGACTRTLLGKVEVVVVRISDDTFRVECWRSFASYAFEMLSEGATDAAL